MEDNIGYDTPFVYTIQDPKFYTLYSMEMQNNVTYPVNLITSIMENEDKFTTMYNTLVNCQRNHLRPKIRAHDVHTNRDNDINIAAIITCARAYYAQTKDRKVIERINRISALLDPGPVLQKYNSLVPVVNGQINMQSIMWQDPKYVTKLTKSIFRLDDCLIDPNKKNQYGPTASKSINAYKQKYQDYMIQGNLDEMLKPYSEVGKKFELNPYLYNVVLDNMPETINNRPLTEMEIATYIYTRLCQIFKYDPVYTYYTEKGIEQHIDPFKLSQIGPHSSILCYEFSYIYSKFLESFGIEHAIVYGNNEVTTDNLATGNFENEARRVQEQGSKEGYYSNGHTYCIVKAKHLDGEPHVFVADSTKAGTSWDLDNLKTSSIDLRQIVGLTPINYQKDFLKTQNALEDAKRSACHLISQEHNKVDISDITRAYSFFSKNDTVKPLTFDQKRRMIHSIIGNSQFVNDLSYYHRLRDILKAIGLESEFVIANVGGFLEVNALIEYSDQEAVRGYEILYPPGEFEVISPQKVIEQFKKGDLSWKPERERKSSLLKNIRRFGDPQAKNRMKGDRER